MSTLEVGEMSEAAQRHLQAAALWDSDASGLQDTCTDMHIPTDMHTWMETNGIYMYVSHPTDLNAVKDKLGKSWSLPQGINSLGMGVNDKIDNNVRHITRQRET